MGSIDRYIIQTCLGAFVLVLVSLTAVIWVTHALREIDLMTNQGQTILVFLGITGLLIPLLVLVIAPIALVIAVSYAINKFNSDSEIVVMNAAGMSPWRMFRPFLTVAITVGLMVGFISSYLAPKGLRELRDWATKVRADLVTNIAQPGRFMSLERGLTFHIRERRTNGQLVGIFIDDQRNPNERATFLAEHGEIVKTEKGSYLVLANGSMQRLETGKTDPAIVLYDRYAFDLSRFAGSSQSTVTNYGVRERFLWDLFDPDPNDPMVKAQPGQFRAEFHDRLLAPFYPLAFVVIAFAVLGAPRTTRQSRGFSLGLAIAAVSGLRMIGFAAAVFAVNSPSAILTMYGSIALTLILGFVAISRGTIIEPPAMLTKLVDDLTNRFMQRFAQTG
ncbi:MAG TPA: LPS export ABC transporter permease LptF [Xanthobacteraceae bacterium]|jgi:lipopolysaccharide export system permease protein|nr:LPS export ABC transporter permease LptF [Xanthobacteraceae bacterium]